MKIKYTLWMLALMSLQANADNSTLDAAIGGALGGAAGAAIGNEIGGRQGAIVGGALGAAAGTAVTTDHGHHHAAPYGGGRYYTAPPAVPYYGAPAMDPRSGYGYPSGGHPGYHCPPGQAKKGRC
ncbi:MAG: hypothetical protein KIT59_05610 [Nitrosomonas sp.]|nr:hypothetical protein [Nitrosomonas sp.]